jgi:ATP-binding protein involved in chromosome partitioning
MIVVTTPAVGAQKVATRAATMARKSYLRIAGVIENMSVFVAPDGSRHEVFGSGGGEALAQGIGAPLLGSVPIEAAVAHGSDTGAPIALGEGPAAEAFRAIAERIVTEAVPPVDMAGCSARMLDGAMAALDALDALDAEAATTADGAIPKRRSSNLSISRCWTRRTQSRGLSLSPSRSPS